MSHSLSVPSKLAVRRRSHLAEAGAAVEEPAGMTSYTPGGNKSMAVTSLAWPTRLNSCAEDTEGAGRCATSG